MGSHGASGTTSGASDSDSSMGATVRCKTLGPFRLSVVDHGNAVVVVVVVVLVVVELVVVGLVLKRDAAVVGG